MLSCNIQYQVLDQFVLTDLLCSNFWQYFEPIRQNMPKNCSADIETAMAYIDQILTNGTASDVAKIKSQFALDGMQHNDDVAAARKFSIIPSFAIIANWLPIHSNE